MKKRSYRTVYLNEYSDGELEGIFFTKAGARASAEGNAQRRTHAPPLYLLEYKCSDSESYVQLRKASKREVIGYVIREGDVKGEGFYLDAGDAWVENRLFADSYGPGFKKKAELRAKKAIAASWCVDHMCRVVAVVRKKGK